ncbi:glycosyltransferase [Bifidobacterium bifidum]|uniref:glycosyltransferase n=1 Tax=Bifidobacterium bifidum TaxID=1681 RepID=UPI003D0272AC
MFVDDGSKDSTRNEIREFASNRFDTGFIFLSRNFGKEHAMLAGIQLLALGVIGEYLGRTFIQTKNRPSYLIEEEQRPKER